MNSASGQRKLTVGVVALAAIPLAVWLIRRSAGSKVELHEYQKDFLDSMAEAQGLGGPGPALQVIVDKAMSDDGVQKAIFNDVHCVHCGSVAPPVWIKDRKGKKEPYTLALSAPAVAFLNAELLPRVEKVGEPPKKQVVPGPLRADMHKAARCCIDWAIKNYGTYHCVCLKNEKLR
jgi:hypothetical protein